MRNRSPGNRDALGHPQGLEPIRGSRPAGSSSVSTAVKAAVEITASSPEWQPGGGRSGAFGGPVRATCDHAETFTSVCKAACSPWRAESCGSVSCRAAPASSSDARATTRNRPAGARAGRQRLSRVRRRGCPARTGSGGCSTPGSPPRSSVRTASCSTPARSISTPSASTEETAALLRGEIDRIESRIDCLACNRDALRADPSTVRPGTPASAGRPEVAVSWPGARACWAASLTDPRCTWTVPGQQDASAESASMSFGSRGEGVRALGVEHVGSSCGPCIREVGDR